MGPGYPSRRTVLCATVFSLSLHATYAQSSFNGRCSVTSTPILARAEGLTERLGDINLQCTGGTPGSVLSGNLTFFFPVSVTNRVDMNNQTHDAVLSVDSGSGFVASAVAGQVSANSISFNGLNFPVPTGSLNLKISGIRGAMSQLGPRSQQPVTASISATLPLNQAAAIVAYPQTSLTATLYNTGIPCVGSPAPSTFTLSSLFAAGTSFASTRLTEGYAGAFEARQATADSGLRFLVKYSGFPANAHIYIPDAVAGSDADTPTAGGDLDLIRNVGKYVPGSGTLVLVRVTGADATGAGGFRVFPPQGSGAQSLDSVSEVALTNGSGYAVYEVADANPIIQESAQFPTFITVPGAVAPATASESVSLAPVSALASASTTAPVARFIAAPAPSDCGALADCDAKYFPKLNVNTGPLQISAIANGGIMTSAPGYIPIVNSQGGLLIWNAVITYQTGSGWLFVDYASGVGNGSVRVWSDTKNLAAGTYQATVTINAGGAGSQTIPLTLTVAPAPPPPPPPPVAPIITISKVVNAATFGATPLVAGSLATVMGSHFAGKNVSVAFDSLPATLLFAGESQINLQVPIAIAGKTTASLTVTVDGAASAAFPVSLAAAGPSVFAHGVLNQDGSENQRDAAAKPGDILQIFATGIPKGALVSAQIGDHSDLVPLYAGEAPGLTGIQQVNVAVPDDVGAAASLILCATVPGGQQYCSSGYQLAVR